jgi:predicted GH43/DUF377 family glycosyl hydrolase
LTGINFTRRGLLQAAAALPLARSGLLAAGAVSSKEEAVLPLELSGQQASLNGVRYDAARKALLLLGEPGSYAREGAYTSQPFALPSAAHWNLAWKPRWTTPLEWERFPNNPLLTASKGSWDDTEISTCSVVPADDRLTMFYGARDRGIGIAVCDGKDLTRWKKQGGAVLRAGAPGAFDAGGVLSPAVLPISPSEWYMYYVGYDPTRMRGPIKTHQIGLAKSTDGGSSWTRVSTEPVLALGPDGACDGATCSSNSVLRVGERWYNWYTGISQVPYLASVCLATSTDGIHWEKYAHNPVLGYNPYVATDAFMVATPQVLYEEGVFKMWYNSKGFEAGKTTQGDYRIGYAESLDGIHWERCARLPVLGSSGNGWDSQMAEYPEVQNVGGHYYMWYCGNRYSDIGCSQGRAITHASVESRTGSSPTPNSGWTAWRAHDTPLGSSLNDSRGYVQLRITLRTADPTITPMIQMLTARPG